MNLFRNLINNLGYVVILAFIISNISIVKKIIQRDKFRKRELTILALAFAIFGIIGTYSGTDVNGAIANTRIIGVMAGGILCGPFVGIVAGTLAGIHRFTYDIGGITSIPCAIATIIAGFISAILYKKGTGHNKWFYGFIGGLVMESIEMLLILLISKPYTSAVSIVKSIYFPMTFTNALGISILILLIERIFNEKDQIAASQAQLALEIANKTLPYFRDVTNDSLVKICSIIKFLLMLA